MIEGISAPYRVQTTLEKRHEGEEEPYETLTDSSWHEPDGTEITDQRRIQELEEGIA